MSHDRNIQALHRAVGHENDGAFFEAEQIYKQLVRQPRGVEMAHYQYAQFLLRLGEYEKAWPHFMRRLETPEYQERSAASLTSPYWDAFNSDIDATQTILVYADQGIGDALMCARFLPILAERFNHVVFVVFEGFRELFASIPSDITVIEFGDPLPAFDVHADLFSIPALLNISPHGIPDPVCLSVAHRIDEDWLDRLSADDLKVGLVWQGNPHHSRDAERSVPLDDFYPILESRCCFYSLQVGDGETQIRSIPAELNLNVFPEISQSVNAKHGKMLKTAAVISNLDLVITVDTAVAHLAGALGVPTWVLVSKNPDWRWMMGSAVSPWYPNSRIYRAEERYDWVKPIGQICDDLNEMIRGSAPAIASP